MFFKIEGVVLRETDYNDTDRMLTVLTGDRGRVSLKARGVRSSRSPLKAACQLLAYNEGGFNMKEFAIGSIGPALVYFITFMIWFPVCFNVL